MERSTFDDGFDWLENWFKREESHKREHYKALFGNEPDEIFCAAIHRCTEKLRGFPTPDELRKMITESRDELQANRKERELFNPEPMSRPEADSGFVRELVIATARVLDKHSTDRLTLNGFADELMRLENKYPGKGCRAEVHKIRMHLLLKTEVNDGE